MVAPRGVLSRCVRPQGTRFVPNSLLAAWVALTGLSPRAPSCGTYCTCPRPRDPQAELRGSAAVVEGLAGQQRPYGLRGSGFATVTRIVVERVWKGSIPDTLYVFSGAPGGTDCGFEFKVGVRYLLYLYREPEGRWAISICSLSVPSASVAGQLRILGTPQRLVVYPSPPAPP